MLYSTLSVFLLATAALGAPAALPAEQGDLQYLGEDANSTVETRGEHGPICFPDKNHKKVLSAVQETGWTFPVAGAGCNAGSTQCTIAAGKTYTVGKTITVGGGLDGGFGDLIKAALGGAFTASYAWSEDHSTSVTVSSVCPKRHQCQQQATSQMLHVKGYTYSLACDKKTELDKKDFEVFYPVTYKGSAKDSEAVIQYSACTIGGKDSKKYPRCPPAGGEPRPAECDPIGAKAAGKKFNPTCR